MVDRTIYGPLTWSTVAITLLSHPVWYMGVVHNYSIFPDISVCETIVLESCAEIHLS